MLQKAAAHRVAGRTDVGGYGPERQTSAPTCMSLLSLLNPSLEGPIESHQSYIEEHKHCCTC